MTDRKVLILRHCGNKALCNGCCGKDPLVQSFAPGNRSIGRDGAMPAKKASASSNALTKQKSETYTKASETAHAQLFANTHVKNKC